MSSIVLEVQNVNRIFGQGDIAVHAVNDVSFKVKKGEFMLIVGGSGSGKSSLLNLIGLLDKPNSGKIFIDGIETTDLTDDEISEFRNKKLGFIFQFSNLLADITVLKNITLPRRIMGDEENVTQDAMKLLETIGIKGQENKRSSQISGGQAQRVAIARALINKPAIVLADEPTGSLDTASSNNIINLMKTMSKQLGQTFIIVTHDRDLFGEVDHVVTIKDGRAFEGDLEASQA